jgi:hypothetical protein
MILTRGIMKTRFYIALSCALLVGCSTTKTMYGWEDYQPEVYEYFQGNDVDQQIITLEKNLEQFKAQNKLAPPGFHAHLGMLYAQVGNMDRAAQEFATEKQLFPESTPYMDFLLHKKMTATSNQPSAKQAVSAKQSSKGKK